MVILFVHSNYPAQFRHLASSLGQSTNNKVIFLTARNKEDIQTIEGVTIRHFREHRKHNSSTHHYLHATEDAILRGQAVLKAINELIAEGIFPRLVISHGGNGLGLFIKDILPAAKHIGLFEWYFKPTTSKWLFEKFEINEQLMTHTRNLTILQELIHCDTAVVPTQWQKQQFPTIFHKKLSVIFDGIDKNFFRPGITEEGENVEIFGEELEKPIIIRENTKILSYATRGMETIRGFPEFMNAAEHALEALPELIVVIAGRDIRAYGYNAPNNNGSWKIESLAKIKNDDTKDRIIFTGLMPYMEYRKLLSRSNLHCYFTRPYVTSWSLFEAAACGSNLCINRTEATKNIVEVEKDITWVKLDEPEELNKTIISALIDSNKTRAKLKEEYSLTNCLREWESLINKTLVKT